MGVLLTTSVDIFSSSFVGLETLPASAALVDVAVLAIGCSSTLCCRYESRNLLQVLLAVRFNATACINSNDVVPVGS